MWNLQTVKLLRTLSVILMGLKLMVRKLRRVSFSSIVAAVPHRRVAIVLKNVCGDLQAGPKG